MKEDHAQIVKDTCLKLESLDASWEECIQIGASILATILLNALRENETYQKDARILIMEVCNELRDSLFYAYDGGDTAIKKVNL